MINVELKNGTNGFQVRFTSICVMISSTRGTSSLFVSPSCGRISSASLWAARSSRIAPSSSSITKARALTAVRHSTIRSLLRRCSKATLPASRRSTIRSRDCPFPNNPDSHRRNFPTDSFFLKYFQLPNTPQGNFVYNGVGINNDDQFDIRVDHQLRPSDSLKATYIFQQPTYFVPGSFPETAPSPPIFVTRWPGLAKCIFSPPTL